MSRRRGLSLVLSGLVLAGLLAVPVSVFADVKVVRVYVPAPPPPPQVEVVGVAPSPGHAWLAGYHRWDGRAYVWVPGHWDVRPRPRAAWVKGRWRHHPRGWYWVEGHWR